jgi:class 3 adenylate cyclase
VLGGVVSGDAVNQDLIAPEYSNRLLQGLLIHFEEEIGIEALTDVVVDAGLPLAHLRDTEGWVSREYLQRFVASAALRLHGLAEPPPHGHAFWQHWRQGGRALVQPGVVGALYPVVRALGSPGNLYRALPALASRGNALIALQVEAKSGRAVVTVTPTSTPAWSSPNCWDMVGMLEAGPRIWGLSDARVVHATCICDPHRPAKQCVYHVSYPRRGMPYALTLVFFGSAGAGLGALLDYVAHSGSAGLAALAGAFAAVAVTGWWRYVRAVAASKRDIEQLGDVIVAADQRYARLWQDEQDLRRSLLTARKLAGYLAPDLVERVVENPELELTLGGRLTRAAVLFADIVGFTPRSEGQAPEDVVEELNIYFSCIDPAFDKHDGVIDKRMGDGVMAVFPPREGDVVPQDVDLRAVRCAVDMLRALRACNDKLAELDSSPLAIRIGVARGELIQGNMGSATKLEYTVIGDIVNVAARLEGQATPNHSLVAAAMIEHLPKAEAALLEIGEVHSIQVKGRREPVEVVEIGPRSTDQGN